MYHKEDKQKSIINVGEDLASHGEKYTDVIKHIYELCEQTGFGLLVSLFT